MGKPPAAGRTHAGREDREIGEDHEERKQDTGEVVHADRLRKFHARVYKHDNAEIGVVMLRICNTCNACVADPQHPEVPDLEV